MADSVFSLLLIPLFGTIALWFTAHVERGLAGELIEAPPGPPASPVDRKSLVSLDPDAFAGGQVALAEPPS